MHLPHENGYWLRRWTKVLSPRSGFSPHMRPTPFADYWRAVIVLTVMSLNLQLSGIATRDLVARPGAANLSRFQRCTDTCSQFDGNGLVHT